MIGNFRSLSLVWNTTIFCIFIFSQAYAASYEDIVENGLKKALNGGHYSEAIAVYNTAIKLQPTHPKAYLLRGSAFRHLGKLQEAVVDHSYKLGQQEH